MANSDNSSPSSINETIITNINNQTLMNISMTNVSKLSATNYLMWSLQVHALVDGYGLIGHLDGSLVVPPPTITNNGETTTNPDYTLWNRQDRLIYSALLGAITLPLQPLVSRALTAAQIWETLASTYAKPSRAHIKNLRQQLKLWKKETKTIDVFVQGVTTRLDQLAILGKPMDHEDQIDAILDGLPEEYKQVIDQIEGRETPPSITELHEKLLHHEAKLASTVVAPSLFPVSANLVQQKVQSHYHNPHKNKNYHNSQQVSQARPH